MKGRPAARRELADLLKARRHLYALADIMIDTSSVGIDESVARIVSAVRDA